MALEKISVQEVQAIEDRAKEIANWIGKIRQEMQENGVSGFELESKLAVDRLAYVEGWAPRAYGQWRKKFAEMKTRQAREKLENAPKKKK